MAEDFIEEMQTEAKVRFGKELSPSEVAEKFALHGFEARIHHLKNLKTADEFRDARRATARFVYERELHNVHRKLSAIDR